MSNTRPEDWKPKEDYEKDGTQIIGWVSSPIGFDDVTARLIYIEYNDNHKKTFPITGWYWADSEEVVKRPDLINGVIPWPEPPPIPTLTTI